MSLLNIVAGEIVPLSKPNQGRGQHGPEERGAAARILKKLSEDLEAHGLFASAEYLRQALPPWPKVDVELAAHSLRRMMDALDQGARFKV